MAVILYILRGNIPKKLLNRIVRDTTDIDIYIKDPTILGTLGPTKRYPPLENRDHNKVKEIDTISYGKVDLSYLTESKFDDMLRSSIQVQVNGNTFKVINPSALLEKYNEHKNDIFGNNKIQRSKNKMNILRGMLR